MSLSRTVTEPAALLEFLFAAFAERKKKQLRTWLKVGAVTVNGRPITQFDHALRRGDVVAIRADRSIGTRGDSRLDLTILFEDDDLVIVEKPAGLLSIATDTESTRTAYRQLTDVLKARGGRSPERVWIVHRLDRETSGVMVFAKTVAAKRALQSSWDAAVKRYRAIVEGRMKAGARGTFESHLDESNPHRVFSTRASAETRHAVTHYEVLAVAAERTLVELTLATGRRHQIRVHLADAGHPVVGDAKYGAKTDPAKRLALHATSLAFPHPRSGRTMSFESPLPSELARLLGSPRSLAWARARG